MKTEADFLSFYRSTLLPELRPLEADREDVASKVLCTRMIIAAITLFLLGFEILFFNNNGWDKDSFKLLVFTVFGMSGLCALIESWLTSKFRSDFKHVVTRQIAQFIEPSARFSADSKISEAFYAKSRLYPQSHEHYTGEDYIEARIGETGIEFSELHTYYYVRTRRGRRQVTVFQGLFLTAEFNKSFKGNTFVLPDLAEKALGSLLGGMIQDANKGLGDCMKMDDPEFEKEFVVYGSDPIEARYILSTSLMKRMLEYTQKTGRKVRYSFIGERLFMAVPYSHNLFEPKLFKSLLDEDEAMEYFEDLMLFLGIVEDLNLNLRIWSKTAAGS